MSASSETRPSMDIAARPSMDIALAKLRQFEAEVSERNHLRRRQAAEVYEALNVTVPREESGEPLAKRACVEVPHNTPVLRSVLHEDSEFEEELEYSESDVSETETETESEVEPEVLLGIPRQNIDWRAAYILQVIILAIYFINLGISIQKIYESTRGSRSS